jgi:thiamine pyrophosphate-dependent acetolactate synthase large subunit-like protein
VDQVRPTTLPPVAGFTHRHGRASASPDAPGMELPGMDTPGIAASYGVPSERVTMLADLTCAVKDALSSDKPNLTEISERRLADS